MVGPRWSVVIQTAIVIRQSGLHLLYGVLNSYPHIHGKMISWLSHAGKGLLTACLKEQLWIAYHDCISQTTKRKKDLLLRFFSSFRDLSNVSETCQETLTVCITLSNSFKTKLSELLYSQLLCHLCHNLVSSHKLNVTQLTI